MPVRAYFCVQKAELAMWLGTEGRTSATLFEKSAQRLAEPSVKKEFLSTIQADLSPKIIFAEKAASFISG
ncbi:MAG: hypothetical protein Q8K00_02010 [Syntrophales bacterium]|nr:hypothetical protein [Syntrophales bacterium]